MAIIGNIHYFQTNPSMKTFDYLSFLFPKLSDVVRGSPQRQESPIGQVIGTEDSVRDDVGLYGPRYHPWLISYRSLQNYSLMNSDLEDNGPMDIHFCQSWKPTAIQEWNKGNIYRRAPLFIGNTMQELHLFSGPHLISSMCVYIYILNDILCVTCIYIYMYCYIINMIYIYIY